MLAFNHLTVYQMVVQADGETWPYPAFPDECLMILQDTSLSARIAPATRPDPTQVTPDCISVSTKQQDPSNLPMPQHTPVHSNELQIQAVSSSPDNTAEYHLHANPLYGTTGAPSPSAGQSHVKSRPLSQAPSGTTSPTFAAPTGDVEVLDQAISDQEQPSSSSLAVKAAVEANARQLKVDPRCLQEDSRRCRI